jgi:hypothetical protein
MGEEEKPLKFRLYMLMEDPSEEGEGDRGGNITCEIFLTDSNSFEEIVEAMKDIFHALWTHDALGELNGFKVVWGED